MQKKQLFVFLILLLIHSNLFYAKDKHFKRVEEFPEGEQIKSVIGSFFAGLKDVNAVDHVFAEPLDKVWPAVKRVAHNFAKNGGRTVTGINEDINLIQNGNISQDAMIGMGSGAWMDQIQMKATAIGDQTKIEVSRKVVQREFTKTREWKTQWSNGKIERYLLTRIEDDLSGIIGSQSSGNDMKEVGAATFSPGKFSREDKPADYIELKSNGTFNNRQGEIEYTGSYGIANNEIICMITNGNGLGFKIKIRGGALIDENGKSWIKMGSNSQKSQTIEFLTNEDILKMVKAKLSGKVIIAKINKSQCDFNTDADTMIELKKAGVSDEIIQAMAEADI
jgi:hypothetical protein